MYGEAYRRGFGRVTTFIEGRDTSIDVPATPDWSAGDVIRHLAGNAEDLVHARIDGLARDEWTANQVAKRSSVPVPEVVVEWSSCLDDVVAVIDDMHRGGFPDPVDSALGPLPLAAVPPMLVNDLLHHEFDIKNAYSDTSGRDLPDVHASAAGHVRSLRIMFQLRGLPTLRVESTDAGDGWNVGRGEPVAAMRATSFEIMRSIGGRRTRDEVAALGWTGDPFTFVDAMVLPHMTMRDASLGE